MAAKTVEEIKDEIVSIVKSQGNQGAISLGDVLDDITELAGEGGGGGGGTPNVISISIISDGGWIIDNPDDLEGLAAKAEQGESVTLKLNAFDVDRNPQSAFASLSYLKSSVASKFTSIATTVTENQVISVEVVIDCIAKTASLANRAYPS